MSSKFNPSQFKKSLLPWCSPPPDPPLGPPIGGPSPALTAYATWADHDPAAYVHASESFQLNAIVLGESYSGDSGSALPRLAVTVERVVKSDYWLIVIEVFRTEIDHEDYGWPAQLADPTDPIQLHPPMDVVIAASDYRSVHIYG